MPGGDYGQVQQMPGVIYGGKRRILVYRMIVAAQTLSPDVLQFAHDHNIPQAHLHENKYYVGHGTEAGKRLSSLTRVTTLQQLDDILQTHGSRAMSSSTFQEEYCAPAKQAENWIASVKKTYGKHADTPAADRVFSWLVSGKARTAILSCMRDHIRA